MNNQTLESGAIALGRIARPRSIAVIGASQDLGKLSGRVVPNLNAAGYAGDVFVVNPNYGEVAGIPSFPTVQDLPYPPDTALVLTPADRVLDVLAAVADKGITTATVVASGIGDGGSVESRRRAAEVEALLRDRPIRILGPNSIGPIDTVSGAIQRASVNLPVSMMPGPVAIASQSGAISLSLLHLFTRAGIGVTQAIPLGNEIDLGMPEAISHFATLEGIEVVVCFAESLRADSARLASALSSAHDNGRTVIALLGGESPLGKRRAAGHTGALATDHRLLRTFLAALGVVVVDNLDELVATTMLALRWPHLGRSTASEGLAFVCLSGGEAVLLADMAARDGIELPQPSTASRRSIEALLRFSEARNPFDVTADALQRPALFRDIYEILVSDEQFSRVAFVLSPLRDVDSDLIAGVLETVLSDRGKTALIQWPSADANGLSDEGRSTGAFQSSTQFISAYRALSSTAAVARPHEISGAAAVASRRPDSGRWADPSEARRILGSSGLRWVEERWVTNSAELDEMMSEFPPPWVMKGEVVGRTHKADWGGVRVDLCSPAEAHAAFDEIVAAAAELPTALRGVWVQRALRGTELYLSGVRDAQLGEFVGVGFGGAMVEAISQAVFIPAPASKAAIRQALRGSPLAPALSWQRARRNHRTLPATAVEDALRSLQDVLSQRPDVRLLEVNPAINVGDGLIAVDVRVLTTAGRQNP
jgi:acyl-CoA synthetase (NDP forming)